MQHLVQSSGRTNEVIAVSTVCNTLELAGERVAGCRLCRFVQNVGEYFLTSTHGQLMKIWLQMVMIEFLVIRKTQFAAIANIVVVGLFVGYIVRMLVASLPGKKLFRIRI